jgi:hypothetical protein
MTEQIRCPPAVAQPALPKFVPGYLLTPFGWAAHPLAAMVAAEPVGRCCLHETTDDKPAAFPGRGR